jgi:hypothetical protein
MLFNIARMSSRSYFADWNCASGRDESIETGKSKRKGITTEWSSFESAPPSKLSHGASKLIAVRQRIPQSVFANCFAISLFQREPIQMSFVETNGLTDGITFKSNSWTASAICRLRFHDQAMNTFIQVLPVGFAMVSCTIVFDASDDSGAAEEL